MGTLKTGTTLTVLRNVVIALCLLIGAVLIHLFTLSLPPLTYHVREPSIARECSKVHIGSSRAEALGIFNENVPPLQEFSDKDAVRISRKGGTCVLELDSRGRVANAYTKPSEALPAAAESQ